MIMPIESVASEQKQSPCAMAFFRQGSLLFLPRPWLQVDPARVLEHEPIRCGAAGPHICRHLYRTAGTLPCGSQVFVNGAVKHPDHPTLFLGYWHQILTFTEGLAAAVASL